ncbi:hypothetical protein GCM10010508_47130 [Streptomyces naganishii JCM 4654]|uniref:Uncharacterized protein n=1 Tax=Streptomyces naganishii JCM 4654 TaxID=1306179 RepID=A0A918Y758_9ACTN|nr:hypothetical protein GCM10010508_47130 [Streptomyces naganishii JCM 4654]
MWAGPEPTQIAFSPDELAVYGVHSAEEEAADALLLRVAVRPGALPVAVPRAELPLQDGAGDVLRYSTAG